MASPAQLNGMRAVYLAAAELTSRGLTVSTTSRGAAGADILATQDCNHTYSVQVKHATRPYFRLGAQARSLTAKSHIYVLVRTSKKKAADSITYYVVPSAVIAKRSRPTKIGKYTIKIEDIKGYEGRWRPLLNR